MDDSSKVSLLAQKVWSVEFWSILQDFALAKGIFFDLAPRDSEVWFSNGSL